MSSILLQLQVSSRDETDIGAVEATLADLDDVTVERWRQPRMVDPITILTVAGGTVGLVNGLMDLKDRWAARKKSPRLTLENESGDQLELQDATREQVESFVVAR
jgi:hypothetical protein